MMMFSHGSLINFHHETRNGCHLMCSKEDSIAGIELQAPISFPGEKVYAEYRLLIRDQVHNQHKDRTEAVYFAGTIAWEYKQFLSLADVYNESRLYLVDDTLIVEAHIITVSSVKKLC